MAKFKVIKFVDNARGIGAIVERTNLFGKKSLWVKQISDGFEDHTIFDMWINSETGKGMYAISYGKEMDNYYHSQKVIQGK